MQRARLPLLRLAATTLAMLLGAASGTLAEGRTALEGRVVDAAGHPIEGVALVLRHGDEARYAVESASEGRFLLTDVAAEPEGYVVELDEDERPRWQLLSYRVEPSTRDGAGELAAEIVISERVAGWAPTVTEGALVTGGVVAGIGAGVSIPVLLTGDDGDSGDGAIAAAEETGRGDSDEEPPSFLPPQHPEPQQPNPDRPSPPPVFAPPPNPSPTR